MADGCLLSGPVVLEKTGTFQQQESKLFVNYTKSGNSFLGFLLVHVSRHTSSSPALRFEFFCSQPLSNLIFSHSCPFVQPQPLAFSHPPPNPHFPHSPLPLFLSQMAHMCLQAQSPNFSILKPSNFSLLTTTGQKKRGMERPGKMGFEAMVAWSCNCTVHTDRLPVVFSSQLQQRSTEHVQIAFFSPERSTTWPYLGSFVWRFKIHKSHLLLSFMVLL